jgi:hypothetical protein
MCGGLTDKRGIEDNDKALFEEVYRFFTNNIMIFLSKFLVS